MINRERGMRRLFVLDTSAPEAYRVEEWAHCPCPICPVTGHWVTIAETAVRAEAEEAASWRQPLKVVYASIIL